MLDSWLDIYEEIKNKDNAKEIHDIFERLSFSVQSAGGMSISKAKKRLEEMGEGHIYENWLAPPKKKNK